MSPAGWPRVGRGALLAAGAVAIALMYAEPILDSDLFWHLAYARQMVERGSLVPDPTLYSWTPVNTRTIYCAWLSELALLGLWQLSGSGGVSAVRYLIIAALAALFWNNLLRLHAPTRTALGVPSLLALLVLLVTAYPGSLQKPEMFSLLLYHAALWCYFRAKTAAHDGADPRPFLYAVPLLMLIWANAHGVHVLLAPLLAATAVGEVLNRRCAPRLAFPGRQLAHLLAAWGLCALAVCLTPYGIAYPLQNLSQLLAGASARPDGAVNRAHLPIYATGAADPLSQPQVFAALAAVVLFLFVRAARQQGRGGRVDCAVALGLAVFLPLSVQISRASHLWPALACYAMVYLGALARRGAARRREPQRPAPGWWRLGPSVAATAFVALALRVGYDAYARPQVGSWLGFGVSYQNPVPEAEYLARAGLGPRVYNNFDSGGYLLWRLGPHVRVMLDARSYPYLDWFEDQRDFANGKNFRAFLARYPADLAIIDLQQVATWRNFVRAGDWHLLFYGPTSAIFARAAGATGRPVERAAELWQLRNARTAFAVFDFALDVGDEEAAWRVLDRIETELAWQANPGRLQRAQTLRAAHAALARGAYDEAAALLGAVADRGVVADRDVTILNLLHLRRALLQRGDGAAVREIDASLARLAPPHLP